MAKTQSPVKKHQSIVYSFIITTLNNIFIILTKMHIDLNIILLFTENGICTGASFPLSNMSNSFTSKDQTCDKVQIVEFFSFSSKSL